MTSPAAPSAPPATEPPRRSARHWLLLLGLLAAAGGVAWYVVTHLGVESTDDAFFEGNVYRVSFEVGGRIAAVPVHDNDRVEVGALLAELDPTEYRLRVDGAQAALALAQARQREAEVQVGLVEAGTAAALARAQAALTAAQVHVEQQRADLDAAEAEAGRAAADLERYQQLSERAVSKTRLDQVRQVATTAASTRAVVQKRIAAAAAEAGAAAADVAAAEADRKRVDAAHAAAERAAAETQQAAAALREAELHLAQTKVVAPAGGRVTKKSVLPGMVVEPGQGVMAVVAPDVWVIANFKETQLAHLRPGQPVSVHVDAYGLALRGHVDSLQAGTGSRFSLLPPENATGNYVKVVQRVPVKILLDDKPSAELLLAPGMSVVPVVEVR